MSKERSQCTVCGGIVPVAPGMPAPSHKDWSRNQKCTGTGRSTQRM